MSDPALLRAIEEAIAASTAAAYNARIEQLRLERDRVNASIAASTNSGDSVSFCQLPSEVLASVLCGFSQGKTISTFLIVALGNSTLRRSALSLCRGALVQRYMELSNRFAPTSTITTEATTSEIRDVLDILREDIRLSTDDDDEIITMFSEWCAILDYFETHLALHSSAGYRIPQWIIWSGRIELLWGTIDAFLVTPHWTAGGMHFWRNKELSNMMLMHPRDDDFHFTVDRIPYGGLFGIGQRDRSLLSIQSDDLQVSVLQDSIVARRHALVSREESYEEYQSMAFVDHSFVSRTHESVPVGPLLIAPDRAGLCCCWDKELGEDDFDDAISRLGEHVIRTMKNFPDGSLSQNFSDSLQERYQSLTEFCNH
jgi:hypothetical protein